MDAMHAAVERFAEVAAVPVVDLGVAALAIGAGADPLMDPQVWLEELDRLAAGVDGIDALVGRLFVERGFTGNVRDYTDPENSFLHRVLARRVGIPITLAVVMIEVGRRAGVGLDGVGMPGHFLVRDRADGTLRDPFDRGRPLTLAAAEERFRSTTGAGPDVAFGPALLPVVGAHQILDRMLVNLAGAYRARGAVRDVEWVVRMRLVLPSAGPEAVRSVVRSLGEALAGQGRFQQGAEEVETRADGDAELLAAARALRARLN